MVLCTEPVSIDYLLLKPLDVRDLEFDHLSTTLADEMIMMAPVDDLLVLLETFSKIMLSNDITRHHQHKRSIDSSQANLGTSFLHGISKILSREVIIDRKGHLDDTLPLRGKG